MRTKRAPAFKTLWATYTKTWSPEQLVQVMLVVPDDSRYLHWDKLRFVRPIPEPFSTHEEWWLALLWWRRGSGIHLPLSTMGGTPFFFSLTPEIQRRVREITMRTSGKLESLTPVAGPLERETYLFSTLIEESITSSQLEGAATTRLVAKEMLRTRRKPVDKNERMIFNNFEAMEFARAMRGERLTPEIVFELHRILGRDALDVAGAEGRFRTADEDIVVAAADGEVIHTPPPAATLEARMQALCDFANDRGPYVDPLLRAIILHFMIGYDHPFADGNGRVARALFYWKTLSAGLELFEFTSISRILLRAPTQYVKAYVETESAECDLTYFILHQLGVLESGLTELQAYLRRKFDERRELEAALSALSLPHRQALVVRALATKPWEPVAYRSHMDNCRVTRVTATSDLKMLADLGVVTARKRRNELQFFPAADLVAALRRASESAEGGAGG